MILAKLAGPCRVYPKNLCYECGTGKVPNWMPISKRQRVAEWFAAHKMPTFASAIHRYHGSRLGYPEFVGKLPPRVDVCFHPKLRVFRMNDCDWWVATTLEEAEADFKKETGIDADDDARELTDQEMETHQFYADGDRTESIPFSEQLEILIAKEGEKFPQLFASTEF